MSASTSPQASDPAPPRHGRRQFIVDRGFQLRYSSMLAAAGALVCLAFGAAAYALHLDAGRSLEQAFQALGAQVPADFQRLLSAQGITLVALTGTSAVLMALALWLFGVLLTHRVAGPVHVLSVYVSALADGRYPTVRPLRKSDELKPFFDRFTHAVEAMRLRDVEEAEGLAHAATVLEPLATTEEHKAALVALKVVCARRQESARRAGVK